MLGLRGEGSGYGLRFRSWVSRSRASGLGLRAWVEVAMAGKDRNPFGLWMGLLHDSRTESPSRKPN